MTRTKNKSSFFHVFSSLFVLSLLLVCSAACQWGIQEVSGLDGETDVDDTDGTEGVEMDVVVDREEGVDDPDAVAPDADDAEDAVDMDAMDVDDAQDAMDVEAELEAGCTSSDDCDDLEPCNGDETCADDGACYDSSPLDDGTPCTDAGGSSGVCIDEVCDTSGCGNSVVEEGEDCDDGNDVEGDGCDNDCAYTCESAADCNDDEICTTDTCVANDNGRICEYENLTISCNDHDACTENDACAGGACGGEDIVCDDDDVCTDNGCNPETGCTFTPNTASCDDGDACTNPDQCDGAGECAGTGFVCACDSLDDCAVHDDGNFCNGIYICDTDNFCKTDPDTVVECDDSSDTDCAKNTCDPDTGDCNMVDEEDGTDCSDDSVCTQNDQCTDGECISGALIDCDDENECTDDWCDPADSCQHANNTDACDDLLFCTLTDVCDGGGSCMGSGDTCDDDITCTIDSCIEDGDSCSNLVNSGFCLIGGECIAHGTENPGNECEECNESLSQTAWSPKSGGTTCGDPGDTECDNPDTCDGAGTCQDNYEGSGTTCGDPSDTDCDNPDTCDGSGTCQDNYESSGTICGDPGDTECDNPDTCDGTGGCQDNLEPNGTPCPDGIDCTDNLCNGSGTCVITPNDMSCAPGSLCLPDCRLDGTGCVTIPGSLDLQCTTPVTPPATSGCTINLGGLTNQTSCLTCTSEVGIVEIDFSDFELGGAGCDLDGWTLVPNTGNQCSRNVGTYPSCTPGGGTSNCNNDMNAICHNIGGNDVLRSDDDLGAEQWRLYKSFDTTRLSNLELCFDFGESGATNNEGLIVYISDSGHLEQVFCEYTPRAGVDGRMYPQCVSLSSYAWANNNPDFFITFLAHSEDNNNEIYLDNVRLKGWVSSCPATIVPVLTDNFNACNLSAWTVTGAPVCPGTWNCAGSSLQTSVSSSWSIQRQIDASGLDGNVELCFDYGDQGGGGAEYFLAEFNAQQGDGWQTAWSEDQTDLGTDAACMQICVNLSDINPDVNRNPDLLIRFVLTAGAVGTYNLDNVIVRGAQYCDGTGTLSLGAIGELGAGLYGFRATDVGATRLDGDINCSWDTPPIPVEDWATVNFIP